MRRGHAKSIRILTSRSSSRGLGIVLFFAFLLTLSTIIYTDSSQKTLEEQRKLTYGSWHVAVYGAENETYQTLSQHAAVEFAGQMVTLGFVTNGDAQTLGSIGYADETMNEMGITLLSGHFPTTSEEVAVEASYLSLLGYSYELGQPITLTVLHEEDNGQWTEQTITLTLCGLVKNYSSYWKANENDLISFFVSPQWENALTPMKQSVFAQLDEKFASLADDLAPLCPVGSQFVKNEFTYLQYSGEDEPETDRLILQTVIVLAGCVAVVLLMNNELRKRRESFVIMRILGTTRLQIIRLFLGEQAIRLLFSSIASIAGGFLIPYLAFLLINALLPQPAYFQLNIGHLLQAVLVLCAGFAVSMLFSLIRLFQIPLRGRPAQATVHRKHPKKKKRLNSNNFFSLFNAADRGKRIASSLLIFVAAAFILISGYRVWDAYVEYTSYCRNYPEDYSFGNLAAASLVGESYDALSEQALTLVQTAYGVAETQAVSVSDYYPISFSGNVDVEYTDSVVHTVKEWLKNQDRDYDADAQILGSIYGISDSLFSTYANATDTELLSGSCLNSGEAILYVPDYYLTEDGSLIPTDTAIGSEDMAAVLHECSIAPGDKAEIKINGKISALTIVGVIHSLDDVPFSLHFLSPYVLLCNPSTYCQLTGSSDYACVLVYRDKTAISFQTDVELSKINGAAFNNTRMERTEQMQQMVLQIVIALITSVFAFLITMLIRFGILANSEAQDMARYRILYQLGMSRKMLFKKLSFRNFKDTLAGMGLALFAAIGYILLLWYRELSPVIRKNPLSQWELLCLACKYTFYHSHWNFIVGLSAITFALNVFIFLIYVCHYTYGVADT